MFFLQKDYIFISGRNENCANSNGTIYSFPFFFFLYIRSLQFPLALQRLKIEAQVFYDLAHHVHFDVAGISLVVEQKEDDNAILLVDQISKRDNTGTARLPTAFRGNGHTDFTDAWRQFRALIGILQDAVAEVRKVINEATMAFSQSLGFAVEITSRLNFEAH